MKIINLDELEQKCIEFGIRNGFFLKEDLANKNLFIINLTGRYKSKCIEISFSMPRIELTDIERVSLNLDKPIRFICEKWEEVYWQVELFFRDYWNYLEDNNKMPLYMKINEAINRHSKNGSVTMAKVYQEILKELGND